MMHEIARDDNYIAYDNAVVCDSKTNLEWYVGPNRDTNWDEAKKWAKGLDLDGGGWRMPTREELKTLYKEGAGTRNMPPLFKTTGWFVWSSETDDSSSAWSVDFFAGNDNNWHNRYYSYLPRVFAVRSRRRWVF
jgi:hypothetical protein